MDVALRKIMPGNTADEVVDIIYDNDEDVLNTVNELKSQLYGDDNEESAGKNYAEVIPASTSISLSADNSRTFFYEIQDAIQGKFIHSIKVYARYTGSFTVYMATALDGSNIQWSKQYVISATGQQEIIIDRELPVNQHLGFHQSGDSAVIWVRLGGSNPVAGGFYMNGALTNGDLCVGVSVEQSPDELPVEGDIPQLWAEVNAMKNGDDIAGGNIDYIALGDSITAGFGNVTTYPERLGLRTGITLANNFAVTAMGVIGSSGFITQVNQVPDNFSGLITIMIGINNTGSTMGDVSAALSKNYEDLNVSSTFAEAFRYCLETLLRKAPSAKILVILPLKSSGRETGAVQIRQIERDICEYFAVPYAEIYKTCGISPLTFSTLMPDGLHPSSSGNFRIEQALWPVVKGLISK